MAEPGGDHVHRDASQQQDGGVDVPQSCSRACGSCRRLLLARAVSGCCADSVRTVPARRDRVGTGLEHGFVISSSAS